MGNVRPVTEHGEQWRDYMKGGLLEGYSWGNVRPVTKHGEQRRTYMKGGLLPERIGLPLSPEITGRTCISGSAACSYMLSGICGLDCSCWPGCRTALPARSPSRP